MLELAILPLTALAARRGVRHAAVLWAGVVILAARGRYRLGPDRVPWTVPFWAPLWAVERGVCVWLALGSMLVGGASYHGRRLRIAAHSTRELQRHTASR
jgi:hypothetical protein